MREMPHASGGCDGQVPDLTCWPDLSAQDRAYRAAKLRDIESRMRKDGLRVARAHPDRARQFMPFAALKGYHELAHAKERQPEPRREVTEERARALSRAIAQIAKGDVVRVVHYENGAYRQTVGAVSEVDEAHCVLRIVRKPIAFADVFEVDLMR